MPKASPLEILNMPMEQNEVHAKTLWQYLIQAQFHYLQAVERHEQNKAIVLPLFPAWWFKQELVYNLVLQGHVYGVINDNGYVTEYRQTELVTLLEDLRKHLLSADITTLQQTPEPKDYALLQLDDLDKKVPYIADHMGDLRTKEDAEKWLETNKKDNPDENWIMVKVK